MSDNSAISWTDATWSPVTGCTKVSDGCTHCYIDRTPPFRMQHRKFNGTETGATTGVKLHSDRLHIPLKWRKPKLIFVCSLADLFQDEVPDQFIAEVFAVMALAPRHTFQVLTKRHARLRSLLNRKAFRTQVQRAALVRAGGAAPWLVEPWWPLRNVWVGVSVENQKWATTRIPALLDTPAAVRFISAEPLLGPIDLHANDTRTFGPQALPAVAYGVNAPDHKAGDGSSIGDLYADMYGPNLDWVIVGGESGSGSRPIHPDWARSLRDQCTAAGVAFHFKQWGEWCHTEQMPEDTWSWLDSRINLGQEPHPEPHRVGKKRAGRLLDGQTWDQYPGVT